MIHLNAHRSLKDFVGLGNGTNNYAELPALKLLLCWLIHLGIHSIQIFGDSMNIIKWFNGVSRCQNYILSPLLEEAKYLKPFLMIFHYVISTGNTIVKQTNFLK